MFKLRQLVRGILSNWVALVLSAAISFLLSPIVVARLGGVGYGVWTLINSMVAYIGLLDLGLRGAVTRYMARDYATGNHSSSSETLQAAIWVRIWIALAAISISSILAVVSGKLFHIPADLQRTAQIAIVLCGSSLAVALLSGVFAAVLAALHRFDLISVVTMCHAIARATGTVFLLRSGHGIAALAVWELSVTLLSGTALVILSRKSYPQLRISLGWPKREVLRSLWTYSSYAFIINITVQIIYYTDNLVVGAFVSAAAVAVYAIGGGIVEILRNINSSLTATFAPVASNFEAHRQYDRLRQLLRQGTRCSLLITLPIATALYFRGSTFIGLWMGAQYAVPSGRIIKILLLAQMFAIANATAGNIVYGLDKHKRVVPWACAEAACNLLFSILLVHRIGVEGVAWGTVIASWIVHLVFWPYYISRILSISVIGHIWQTWIRSGIAAIPFAIACYVTDRLFGPSNLLQFFVQILAILPLFLLGVLLVFWKDALELLQQRFQFLRPQRELAGTQMTGEMDSGVTPEADLINIQ
ncbi:MAG TPA: oligosaccharide flippase family protein [Terriglobales bacterium]